MEKTLVKTAIYSFITSFLLLLVSIDRVRTVKDAAGMYSGVETPYPDYFFMILRYSILITFIIVLIVFLIKLFKKYKK